MLDRLTSFLTRLPGGQSGRPKQGAEDPHVAAAALMFHVVNADAFVWLDQTQTEPFDIAIVDFPDPNNYALGKLYTTRFYNLLKQKLKPDSSVVIQTTSPLIARSRTR